MPKKEPLKKIEYFFKGLLLNTFLSFNQAPKNLPLPKLNKDSKVVFLRLNKIGDALVGTPLIKEIKEKIGCQIIVVADQKNHFVFKKTPFVDQVMVYKKGIRGILALKKQIEALNATVLVDLHENLSTTLSILAGIIKMPYKFALQKENAKLFTHTVPSPNTATHHVIECVAELAKLFQISCNYADLNVTYEPESNSWVLAEKFLKDHFPEKNKVIAINAFAGAEERFWGIEKFKALTQDLDKKGLPYLVICPSSELERAKQFCKENLIFCSPKFDDFAAIIGKSAVLFSPDTSAVHLASAYKTPVFGLYVNEKANYLNWYPYQSAYDWIICKPPLSNISYQEAWQKFETFLDNKIFV